MLGLFTRIEWVGKETYFCASHYLFVLLVYYKCNLDPVVLGRWILLHFWWGYWEKRDWTHNSNHNSCHFAHLHSPHLQYNRHQHTLWNTPLFDQSISRDCTTSICQKVRSRLPSVKPWVGVLDDTPAAVASHEPQRLWRNLAVLHVEKLQLAAVCRQRFEPPTRDTLARPQADAPQSLAVHGELLQTTVRN